MKRIVTISLFLGFTIGLSACGSSGGGIDIVSAARMMTCHSDRIGVQVDKQFILLRWRGTGAKDSKVTKYQIVRKEEPYRDDWIDLAKLGVLGDDTGWYEYKDTNISSGKKYIYRVVGLDATNIVVVEPIFAEIPPFVCPRGS